MSAAADHAENTTPGQAFIKSCMGRTLCVTVSDGRLFEGELRCVDNACNLVMAMAFEYRGHPEDEAVRRERRMVGTVVVPGKHITRIEISELHFQ